jgi:hypothetical protein
MPAAQLQAGGATDQNGANLRSGWRSPLSAALIASRYLLRASPSSTILAEPHVNAGRPSFIASTSAINRACLPLPFGNGWMSAFARFLLVNSKLTCSRHAGFIVGCLSTKSDSVPLMRSYCARPNGSPANLIWAYSQTVPARQNREFESARDP